MASNCASNCDDSVTTITQLTSGSEIEDEEYVVKALHIVFVNNRDNNQYAELASFAVEAKIIGLGIITCL